MGDLTSKKHAHSERGLIRKAQALPLHGEAGVPAVGAAPSLRMRPGAVMRSRAL